MQAESEDKFHAIESKQYPKRLRSESNFKVILVLCSIIQRLMDYKGRKYAEEEVLAVLLGDYFCLLYNLENRVRRSCGRKDVL